MGKGNQTGQNIFTGMAIISGIGIVGFLIALFTFEPTIETTETEIESIPYETTYVDDASVEYGKTVVKKAGVAGKRENTYKVTTKGKNVKKELIDSENISEPVNEIVGKGTKVVWHCQDATSYDRNPYNDNYCENSKGAYKYVSDSQAEALDRTYRAGKSGHSYYNSF